MAMAKRGFLSALDLAAASLTIVCTPLLKLLARVDGRFPMARRVMDMLEVSVIRHHYYSPMVKSTDLHRPLDKARELPGLDLNVEQQLRLIRQFTFRRELEAIPLEQTSPTSFAYHNSTF